MLPAEVVLPTSTNADKPSDEVVVFSASGLSWVADTAVNAINQMFSGMDKDDWDNFTWYENSKTSLNAANYLASIIKGEVSGDITQAEAQELYQELANKAAGDYLSSLDSSDSDYTTQPIIDASLVDFSSLYVYMDGLSNFSNLTAEKAMSASFYEFAKFPELDCSSMSLASDFESKYYMCDFSKLKMSEGDILALLPLGASIAENMPKDVSHVDFSKLSTGSDTLVFMEGTNATVNQLIDIATKGYAPENHQGTYDATGLVFPADANLRGIKFTNTTAEQFFSSHIGIGDKPQWDFSTVNNVDDRARGLDLSQCTNLSIAQYQQMSYGGTADSNIYPTIDVTATGIPTYVSNIASLKFTDAQIQSYNWNTCCDNNNLVISQEQYDKYGDALKASSGGYGGYLYVQDSNGRITEVWNHME